MSLFAGSLQTVPPDFRIYGCRFKSMPSFSKAWKQGRYHQQHREDAHDDSGGPGDDVKEFAIGILSHQLLVIDENEHK
jgi:hypothetical protein